MKKNGSVYRSKQTLEAAKLALESLDHSLGSVELATKIISERTGDIVVTGIGKSRFVGQKIAATLTSLGHRSTFLHPVEAIHGDIGALHKGDVLLALSFSGESKEVVKITAYAKKNFDVPVVSFTKSKKSSLGKLSDVCVEIKVSNEGSPNNIAPMASTTASLVLGDMLASSLMSLEFKDDNFAKFHPGGALGLRLKKVKEFAITGNSLPLVNHGDPFLKILKEISRKKLGATGVLDLKGRLCGIITDGDIRRALIRNKDSKQIRAADIMTQNPKSVQETDSLETALARMEEYKITHLFVTNSNSVPIGIIHIHSFLEQTI